MGLVFQYPPTIAVRIDRDKRPDLLQVKKKAPHSCLLIIFLAGDVEGKKKMR
jgi:hypothetical protein